MKGKDENPGQNRDVYLPLMYSWYPSNLRPWDDQSVALGPPVNGGSVINYTARITNEYSDYPFVTPVYLREGIWFQLPPLESRTNIRDNRCYYSTGWGQTMDWRSQRRS